jgi:hypothetical protein
MAVCRPVLAQAMHEVGVTRHKELTGCAQAIPSLKNRTFDGDRDSVLAFWGRALEAGTAAHPHPADDDPRRDH